MSEKCRVHSDYEYIVKPKSIKLRIITTVSACTPCPISRTETES